MAMAIEPLEMVAWLRALLNREAIIIAESGGTANAAFCHARLRAADFYGDFSAIGRKRLLHGDGSQNCQPDRQVVSWMATAPL
ncbi:MAG: hypothetical protein U0401_27690 [Anaerolineae bacterium]